MSFFEPDGGGCCDPAVAEDAAYQAPAYEEPIYELQPCDTGVDQGPTIEAFATEVSAAPAYTPEPYVAPEFSAASLLEVPAASGPGLDPVGPQPEVATALTPVALPVPDPGAGTEMMSMGGYDLADDMTVAQPVTLPAPDPGVEMLTASSPGFGSEELSSSWQHDPAYANITDAGRARAEEAQRQASASEPGTPGDAPDHSGTPTSDEEDLAAAEWNRRNFGLYPNTPSIPIPSPPPGTGFASS